MGVVHYDDPVPVPEGSHAQPASRRVIDLIPRGQGQDPCKKLIGKLCLPDFDRRLLKGEAPEDAVFMYPNEFYYDRHASEYLAFNPKGASKICKHQLIVGLYILVLTIVTKIGLYAILLKRYGALAANAILDFAMYAIAYQSENSNTFTEWMANHVLFTVKPYSDSWYSAFRNKTMSEDINHAVREDWIKLNIQNAETNEAIIAIDGTNFNCEAKKVSLAAPGKAKTHIHIPIVGMTGVIIANGEHKGRPLTYLPCKGSMPDKVSIFRMMAFWKGKGLKPKLCLFDRGYLTEELMKELLSHGIDFQAMMTENSNAYKVMFEKYSLELRTKVKYMMESKGMFGISETEVFPFQSSDTGMCASLYYDSLNGPQRADHLIEKILDKKAELEGKIRNNKNKNNEDDEEFDSAGISKYLKKEIRDGETKVTIDFEKLQPDWFAKGYSTMVASKEMTANEMNEDYDLRDSCEKFFSILKTMLGFSTEGVYSENAWLSMLFIGFIASIIRNEIMRACNAERVDTSKFIADLCNIVFMRSGDVYSYDGNFPSRVAKVLKHFGLKKQNMMDYEEYVNLQYNSEEELLEIRSKPRSIPTPKNITKDSKKTDDTDKLSDPEVVKQEKKRGGRKLGSKNKKTQEREKQLRELRAAAGLPEEETTKEKRGPGRPKWSRNIKTLERMAEERRQRLAAGLPEDEPKVEKKIGRPKGSKNKKKDQKQEEQQQEQQEHVEGEQLVDPDEANPVAKPHKGRTKGTKNKKTLLREREEAARRAAGDTLPQVPKRGRGRPKGSRNKSLVEQEARDAELAVLTGIDILSAKTKKKRDELRRLAEERASELVPQPSMEE